MSTSTTEAAPGNPAPKSLFRIVVDLFGWYEAGSIAGQVVRFTVAFWPVTFPLILAGLLVYVVVVLVVRGMRCVAGLFGRSPGVGKGKGVGLRDMSIDARLRVVLRWEAWAVAFCVGVVTMLFAPIMLPPLLLVVLVVAVVVLPGKLRRLWAAGVARRARRAESRGACVGVGL